MYIVVSLMFCKAVRILKFLALACAVSTCVFGSERRLEVRYPDGKSAKEAAVKPLRLPGNAVSAFSSRWDDSTRAHLKTAKVFKNSGMKATFMLTKADEKYHADCSRKFISDGFAIASHTITHRLLPMLLPNEAFYEILAQRIKLESALDVPVVAFALPGYVATHPFYEDAPHLIGDCIVRSGYQVQAALWSDNDEKYSLPKGSLLSSHLFNINDRNPKEDLFVKGVSKALAAQEKDSVAHMTLGVHSWQSDAGFKELERILKKHKRNDFWYCTQNEYAAYTRKFENVKISPAVVRGNRAYFKISCEDSRHLGSNVPLQIEISGSPERVLLDGEEVSPVSGGVYELPEDPATASPKKIDLVDNAENSRDFTGASKKFAGIGGRLFIDTRASTVQLSVKNGSKSVLENCEATFRLPPYFKDGVARFKFPKINRGETKNINFKLPKSSGYAESELGNFYFAAQFDFSSGSDAGRIYFTSTVPGGNADIPSARNTAVFLGSVEKNMLSDDVMAGISNPSSPLKNLGQTPDLKWTPCASDDGMRSFQIKPNSEDANWRKAASKKQYANTHVRLVALEFSSKSEKLTLFAAFKDIYCIWINGEKFAAPKNGIKAEFNGKNGENRVVIAYKQEYWATVMDSVTISADADPFKPVKFSKPKIGD